MTRPEDRLSTALREWRDSERSAEQLSTDCRTRILEASRPGQKLRPLASLFLPLRGWALAGALPVALLTLALGYGFLPGPETESDTAPTLRASRVGDEVVFQIANGGKPHRVYRSTSAGEAGEAMAVTDGRFRDRLDRGGDLVFYRID